MSHIKYAPKNKVILTDCDGVLCDWNYSFSAWMAEQGYKMKDETQYYLDKRYENLEEKKAIELIHIFNQSATMRKLSSYWDSIKYVKKLHEEFGFIFHVISSFGTDEYAHQLRKKNLRELFGDSVFEKYIFLPMDGCKRETLSEYKDSGCIWVEDKPENAELGVEFGLDSLLLNHPYNLDFKSDNMLISRKGFYGTTDGTVYMDSLNETPKTILRVTNWKDIYEYIVEKNWDYS